MIKSSATFFIAVGLLLAGMALPVCAQDETSAPAAVGQVGAATQTTANVSAEKSAAAESSAPAVEKPVTSAAVPEKPVEEEKTSATTTVTTVTTVIAGEKPAAAEPSAPVVEKPVTPAAVPEKPVEEEKSSATTTVATVTTVIAGEKPAATESAVPATLSEKTVAAKVSDFELDRSPEKMAPEGTPAVVVKPEVAAKGETSPQPNASFWKHLFGREKGAGTPVVVAPEKSSTTIAGEPAKPSVTTTNTVVTNKMLTPEELVAAQEEVRRQAKEVEALKALDLAYQAMGRNDFEAALKSFNQAMNVMPIRPHTVETRQKAMQSQAECEYRIALNYYRDGKYPEAKDAIRRVLGYYPAHQRAARLSEQIKKDEARKIARAAAPVPLRHSAEHLDREKQIRTSIDLGRQYYAMGEYEKARREFKNVLVLDANNEEAAAQLSRLYDKMYDLKTDQMDRQQAEMVAQVRETWSPPVKRETAGPEARIQETTIADRGKRRLQEKLNSIVLPSLEFRQANIVDVIAYLKQASIACDKDSAPGEKGVNFILQLKRPGAAAETPAPAAAVQPAEGELAGEEGTAVAQGNVPGVTLALNNIILMDAIKYITEVTGLKYRIEENVVVITPSDVIYGELITRTYKVQPSIAETIIGAGTGANTGGTGTGGATLAMGAAAPSSERGDVKKFFVDAGVPFPEGTSIAYKPSLNLLIVKNTADNLESFERILTSLNVVPVQVEIEARFVEVAQEDLEELGIEWLLNNNWVLAQNASASAPLAAAEQIQVDKGIFSKGLRNLASGASGVSASQGGTLGNILSISGILTNPEMTMVLHALDQKTGANLLSAPKVTTKSGANAEIKVVVELIYPTEFTMVTPSASGSTQGSITPIAYVQPGGFQTRDTGVILNVTPTVGPDGFSIDLVMLPQVCELTDWIDYGYDMPNPNQSTTGTYHLKMPQPIFKSRNITTGITIWDGQTVVMGGLITEKQSTTLDKIPILGDLPLVGHLFQSKTSDSQKFNLLIFVTANLVDPAGNKINKELIATAAGTAGAPAAVLQANP